MVGRGPAFPVASSAAIAVDAAVVAVRLLVYKSDRTVVRGRVRTDSVAEWIDLSETGREARRPSKSVVRVNRGRIPLLGELHKM